MFPDKRAAGQGWLGGGRGPAVVGSAVVRGGGGKGAAVVGLGARGLVEAD